jgi:hypothetical protein
MSISSKLSGVKSCLFEQNQKSFYLAILRVAVSLFVLKELLINWSSFELLYGRTSFVFREDTPVIKLIRMHYMYLIIVCIFFCLLNIVGVGKWITALLLFIAVYLLCRLNDQLANGGDMMLRLVLLYMIFANSYDHFVFFKRTARSIEQQQLSNLVSNLAAYSIMMQLCVAYFCSAWAKLHDPMWQQGEAVYYALLVDRYTGTSFNSSIARMGWLMAFANYATLVFEIAFPFLIWFKRFKKPLMVAGLIMHLLIYIFLMIYGFQIIFLLIYGLFLSNEEVEFILKKFKGRATIGN